MQQAIAMLDAEGLTGLSMRRLAERLDAGAMSLYWYFSTKDDLLRAAADAVIAEAALDDLPGAWPDALRTLMREVRGVLRAHPWAIQIITQSSRLGPNSFRLLASVIEVLTRAGIPTERLDGAVTLVFAYMLGATIGEQLWLATIRTDGSDLQPDSAASEGYPALADLFRASSAIDAEQRLEQGIAAVIAGIRATALPG